VPKLPFVSKRGNFRKKQSQEPVDSATVVSASNLGLNQLVYVSYSCADMKSTSTALNSTNSCLREPSAHDVIELNDLLKSRKIDPERVLVMRHRPTEPELRKVLPWLAAEKAEVFNAYQQSQGEKVEKAMLGAKYVASFIGHEPGKALFVGVYSIGGTTPLTPEEFWSVPENAKLREFGLKGFTGDDGRSVVLWFDLSATEHLASWKGKLIVEWPGLERSWWRWADRNTIAVRAILEDSALDAAMPEWQRICLNWQEIEVLPSRWKAALSQWRGIYYIFDAEAGKGYVGSAYGEENILGRWMNYSATGHGGNTLLRRRNPKEFLFTILQRVSPDMTPDDIIRLEGSWKDRLHTRPPFGWNDN